MDPDPTTRFFTKLKKVVGTLECETAKLRHSFENRHNDEDSDNTTRAKRAYHELHSEVANLKGQIQEQLAQQRAWGSEVSSYIKACQVMEQRLTEDIRTLREHWETYGYQAPRDAQRLKVSYTGARGQESNAEGDYGDESETKPAGVRGDKGQDEEGNDNFSTPPKSGPAPVTDMMRTPQLSDFGLSEMHLKGHLTEADWCSEVPRVNGTKGLNAEDDRGTEKDLKAAGQERGALEVAGRHHSSTLSKVEPLPCNDALRVPRLSDFGLSEVQLSKSLAGLETYSQVSRVNGVKGPELDSEGEVGDANETKSVEGEYGDRGGVGSNHPSSPPELEPLPSTNVLRSPQLSDFGLSEADLTTALAGGQWCSEVPPMPQIRIPNHSLDTPAPPRMPLTPKCALRMDDDDLLMRQMPDFSISEHTMCMNNDFTMDLFWKKEKKPPGPQVIPVDSQMESFQTKADDLDSPEPPVFCTPESKMGKTNIHWSPAAETNGGPESHDFLRSPEAPVFNDEYLDQLVSTKKVNDKTLQRVERESGTEEPCVNSLELDAPTQEFSFRSPHHWADFQEPSTPEMLDHSSVTEDICKLVSRSQLKRNVIDIGLPPVRPVKHSAPSMSAVSESEFQSLPNYLKTMPLTSLNQAIHSLNTFMEECPGQQTEFHIEELKSIISAGAAAPIYVFALAQLKRLTQVRGSRNTSVFTLNT